MKKRILWLLPGLTVLLADWLTKFCLEGMSMPLIPGVLGLKSVRNTGMALGLFEGGTAAILLLSAALTALALLLLRGLRLSGCAPAALSLIAGGALGNMLDRLIFGCVRDLFELLFMDFYIFNVADVGVVAGAILCGWSLLFRPQDWSKK